MQWSNNNSLKLSKISLWVFGVCLGIACAAAPWYGLLCKYIFGRTVPTLRYTLIVLFFAIPAYIAVHFLYKLLTNIEKEQVFTDENIRCLRIISWCCFAGAAVFFAGAFKAVSCILLCALAAFIGIILRVIKNVFERAVALQNENDLTI
ncbi:MAG: DUF2975 domain-containing protein [Clostridia bacterium]|nr:DUF2975 domain-containing protein [Clostridia bacterium]NLS84431.1 DUF2975 domain-containing protein [Oscillospiraceae bacterium]